jgi:hypothetical protein
MRLISVLAVGLMAVGVMLRHFWKRAQGPSCCQWSMRRSGRQGDTLARRLADIDKGESRERAPAGRR